MKLFLFDLESSGISTENDRILEVGYIIWDTKYKKPFLQNSVMVFETDYPTKWEAAEKVNGISYEFVRTYGASIKGVLETIEALLAAFKIDYLVAQNGKVFDLPFLKAEVARAKLDCPLINSLPLIDTKELPYPHAPRSKHLGHLAYDLGIVHDVREKHSALFDCQLMLGILKTFDIEYIVKCASAKTVTLLAHCDYHTKELAKAGGYSWVDKKWQKQIKDFELDNEIIKAKQIGFDVSVC